MADFEMISLVQNHRPDLRPRTSSFEEYYSTRSQDTDTHYHGPASSVALLSPQPTEVGEKVRGCTSTTEIDSAMYLEPGTPSTSMDNASSSIQSKDARSWWSNWWLPEILALSVSIVCLASIGLVLKTVDGRPLADWNSFVQVSVPGGRAMSIAPNSVISFLSTIAKSCLGFTATACISQVKWLHIQNKKHSLSSLQIFDDASRGPLGAVGLFLTAETACSVAAMGALITLAALVIDPFTQLVVTYPLRPVTLENGIASINTTSVYDSGATMQLISDNVRESYLNVPMLGAIYNGIYDLNSEGAHVCSTGNCEWKRWMPSLAVCSDCADVTDQVNRSCGRLPSAYVTDDGGLDPTDGWCNLTTPSGLELSTLFYYNEYAAEYTSTMVNNTLAEAGDDLTLLHMATAIARNDQMTADKVSLIAPSNGSSYTISDCYLRWCSEYIIDVQIINGSIANRKTWLVPLSAPSSLPSMSSSSSAVWNVRLTPGPAPSIFNSSEPVPDFNISINLADTVGTRDYLASILSTSWASSNVGSDSSPPILAQTLYASQDITLTMENLAASMTKHIRASRNHTSIPGQALSNVTYVKVHWGWLSLLIATTGMSVVFLLIVIILSHLSDTFLWKSNSLALLFHGLDGWSPRELDATKVATMTRAASTMEGQLKRDSDGFLKIVRS